MARLGRGRPNRPIVLRTPYRLHESVTLDAFETSAEFPPLVVFTPDANVPLGAFETSAEFPDLDVSVSFSFTLDVFETESEFPPLTAQVPILPGDLITQNYQIEWARMVFGGIGNTYQIEKGSLEGWDDLPEIDSGDAPRSARHGSWPGPDYAQARIVTATVAISETEGGFLQARRDLRRAINVSEDGGLLDLVIRTDGETLLAKAKVSGRVIPTGDYPQGWAPVAIRWTCPDPRRYDLQQQSVTTAAGDPAVTCTNQGDIATSPRIKIYGPAKDPVITNVTLDRVLRFSITLGAGELLDIDTNAGTVVDANGDDAMDALSDLSVPVEAWILAAGDNQVTYEADDDGENGIEIQFRSAFL